MIDENEGWVSTLLPDKKRLELIRKYFSTKQVDLRDNKTFAQKVEISYVTVSSWNEAGRKVKDTLQQRTKSKINKALKLQPEVWTDSYYDEHVFFDKLETYKMIEKIETTNPYKKIDEYIFGEIVRMPIFEENELEFLMQENTVKLPGNLEEYSPDFMYGLVQLLKSRNQIKDALNVLDELEKTTENFKFIHRKEISHLKAILLSHKTIQNWDDAIEILRYLYADRYHLKEPEIITLTASNYKRKALYHPNGTINHPEQIDSNLLGKALSLYQQAYEFKDIKNKYYDAINIAYVIHFLHVLDNDEENLKPKVEVEALYTNLLQNGWKINMKDWWEVTTQVEFLVLCGKEAEAEAVYVSYEGKLEKFELDATIRQIEMYTHFCPDILAKDFFNTLEN